MTRTTIIRLAAVLLAALLALYLVNAVTGGKVAQAVARLQTNIAGAAIESGRDAVQAVGSQGSAEDAIDQRVKENERAIRSAPGADAPVDPALRDTALRGLCRHAANRGDPRCVQFTPAR